LKGKEALQSQLFRQTHSILTNINLTGIKQTRCTHPHTHKQAGEKNTIFPGKEQTPFNFHVPRPHEFKANNEDGKQKLYK
jgi:hypothetical protein